jgi:glycosyltransferase involved in cell wall biosynthesis
MLKNYPKISIVTVSYNQGKFIEDNIKSVIEQNYPNIEHIVIDAGSTDSTLEILKKYDKHLNWLSEPDKGQTNGLNKGFKKATGDIIGWFNSDDRMPPNTLKYVASFFNKHPTEIGVVGNINLITEEGNYVRTVTGESYKYQMMVNRRRGVTQPSTFFKRIVFDKIGYLDENLDYIMDFDFFLRLSKLKDIPHVNQSLADFRLQKEAKTTNGLVNFRREHIKIARKHSASYFSEGILSDLFVIITDPFRRVKWIRNLIRRLKGVQKYDEQKFN